MKQRKPGKRSRGVPVQVMFSEREYAGLQAIAEQRGKSVSQLFRSWVRRAMPKRKRARADPRQLSLA